LTAASSEILRSMVNDHILNDEVDVFGHSSDEDYLGLWAPNWGSATALGTGLYSRWNDGLWTDCDSGTGRF
jgi:hypothetical protein